MALNIYIYIYLKIDIDFLYDHLEGYSMDT